MGEQVWPLFDHWPLTLLLKIYNIWLAGYFQKNTDQDDRCYCVELYPHFVFCGLILFYLKVDIRLGNRWKISQGHDTTLLSMFHCTTPIHVIVSILVSVIKSTQQNSSAHNLVTSASEEWYDFFLLLFSFFYILIVGLILMIEGWTSW